MDSNSTDTLNVSEVGNETPWTRFFEFRGTRSNESPPQVEQSSSSGSSKSAIPQGARVRAKSREAIASYRQRALSKKKSCAGCEENMEWMHKLWTKPLAGSPCKVKTSVCNPLERVLGDESVLENKNPPASLLQAKPKPQSGLCELLDYRSEFEPEPWKRFHLYSADGSVDSADPAAESWNPARKKKLQGLDQTRTIVIGNGGFGGSGGIQHLAQQYNQYLAGLGQPRVNVLWRGGDSNHNMIVIDRIDLAITYEPVLEKRLVKNGLVSEVIPLFVNFFALIIPCRTESQCDPFKVGNFIRLGKGGGSTFPEPYVVLMYIIVMAFKSLASEGQARSYASRWNFSAMGLRDHFIMMIATKKLASLMCAPASASGVFEKAIVELATKKPSKESGEGVLKDVMWNYIKGFAFDKEMSDELDWCSGDAAGQIYLTWHELMVDHHRKSFPREILAAASQLNQYHMNDMAMLPQEDFKDITKDEPCPVGFNKGCFYQVGEDTRADYDINPYANPGDLLLPKRSDYDDSASKKFFLWLKDNRNKPSLWSGFSKYGWAVSHNLGKYDEFNDVLATQERLQKAGEVESAQYARANLYFWGSVNWAATHTEFVDVGPFPGKIKLSREESSNCEACALTTMVRKLAGLSASKFEGTLEVLLLGQYCHTIITPVSHEQGNFIRVTFLDREALVEDSGGQSLSQLAKSKFCARVTEGTADWTFLGAGVPPRRLMVIDRV